MPVKPPSQLFRVDLVDVVRVERELSPEPVIKYIDREMVKEVEKIVYKEDPKLLEQLNKAFKENGELRMQLSKQPKMVEVIKEASPIEKLIEIERIIPNIKREALIAILAFIIGVILCYLTLR